MNEFSNRASGSKLVYITAGETIADFVSSLKPATQLEAQTTFFWVAKR